MNCLNEIDSSFSALNESKFIDLILYGSDEFDDKKNRSILCAYFRITIFSFNVSSRVQLYVSLGLIFLFV